jgi:hypothetical protein
MIKINLLPVEKRKAERTPLPRFFLILTTAGVAAGLVLYIAYILLQIKQTEDLITEGNNELARLKPEVERYERLVTEHANVERKLNEIRALVNRDVEQGWWRAVDALWNVINAHPKVWIDDFRAMDGRTSGGDIKRVDPQSSEVPPYAVNMRCHVAGSEVHEMTRFRKSLKDHPVLQEMLTTVNFNVDWKVDKETGFAESNSISFTVTLFAPSQAPKRKAAPPAVPGQPGAPQPAQPINNPAVPATKETTK